LESKFGRHAAVREKTLGGGPDVSEFVCGSGCPWIPQVRASRRPLGVLVLICSIITEQSFHFVAKDCAI
jgi:hypothetical protein